MAKLEFGYSPLLDQQVLTQRAQVITGLIGSHGSEESFRTFDNEDNTAVSLRNFAIEQRESGLAETMNAFRIAKTVPSANPAIFTLSSSSFEVDTEMEFEGRKTAFYTDGEHTLFLGRKTSQQEDPIPVAAVSLLLGNRINAYLEYTNHEVRFSTYSPKAPIVVQLQAIYSQKELEDDAQNPIISDSLRLLSQYDWKSAMIDLVDSWASQSGSPCMYILPSFYNMNNNSVDEHGLTQRLSDRYDWVALRNGFSADENGILKKELLYPTFSFP